MPAEESDDLYDGDYEFVDDEDDATEAEPDEKAKPKKTVKRKTAGAKKPARKKKKAPASRAKKEPAKESLQETAELEEESVNEGDAETSGADQEKGDTEKGDTEKGDEYGRTEPETNYVVHVYELKKFKRTIDYKFTPEDADAFATEYNRTGKTHSRWAVPGKEDVKPGKVLAQ